MAFVSVACQIEWKVTGVAMRDMIHTPIVKAETGSCR